MARAQITSQRLRRQWKFIE